MRTVLAAAVAFVAVFGASDDAAADPVALVIGNESYDTAPQARGGRDVQSVVPDLQSAGFTVLGGLDRDTSEMQALLARFWTAADPLAEDEPGPLVILLAGHFVSTPDRGWFLGREAEAPGLGAVDGAGLSVQTVLDIAGHVPSGSVVVLARADVGLEAGVGLAPGLRGLDVPQGVLVVQGPIREAVEFVRSGLLTPGMTYAALQQDWPGLRFDGYVTSRAGLLPERPDNGFGAPPDPFSADRAAWDRARAADTVAAYEDYLRLYPVGLYAASARTELARLRAAPPEVERSIGLSSAQRRAIQADLTALGYSTRGVDGIFGPGTRNAIGNWQGDAGFPVTQYLTAEQIARIADMAERRRAEERANDRTYWQATGAGGDEAGLRAYLDRYPNGEFAALARSRLSEIEAETAREAERQDRAAWEQARNIDRVPAYRQYLDTFPDGLFRAEAAARIRELRGPREDPDIARARDAEAALGIGPLTRLLLEQRLSANGFAVGRVDGVFDDDTRSGIAAFQQSLGERQTGFLTRGQIDRLVPSAFLQLLE